MNGEHLHLATLAVLFGVVAFGAVIPVLPTGAAVSGAAALAGHENLWAVLSVVVVGGAGAYVGDVITYGALSSAGEPLAQRLGWLKPDDDASRLNQLRAAIEHHELRTLLVSRLVPGGRIPVLLVAALTGYPWYRFASAAVGAATLWALAYSVIGLLGSTLLPDAETAAVVAALVAVVVTLMLKLVKRWGSRTPPQT